MQNRSKPGKKQKDSLTFVNLNNFRIVMAKARRTKQVEAKFLKNNVSNLNMPTPINNWNTIRKIKGKGTAEKYKHLKLDNHILTEKGNL